jgi:hypothetical protein
MKDGGPAFPMASHWVTDEGNNGGRSYSGVTNSVPGMSVRTYLAAEAMKALLSRSDLKFVFHSEGPEWNAYIEGDRSRSASYVLAQMSFEAADAMIEEGNL